MSPERGAARAGRGSFANRSATNGFRACLGLVAASLVLAVGCEAGGTGLPGTDGGAGLDAAGRPADAAGGAGVDGGAGLDASRADASGGPQDGGFSPDSGAGSGVDSGVARLDAWVATLSNPASSAEDLDAILHEVAWSGGWPVQEGERWLFVTRWDEADGVVSLVGDHVGWSPSTVVAESAATGVHYWVLIEERAFVVAPHGAQYKWHASVGDQYRAPPEATAYGFDTFGEHGFVAPPADTPWRERYPDHRSAFLSASRTFRALLPAGFEAGSATAASARALFLHDGQNVFDEGTPFGGWRVHEALAADPAYADVVVLAVDNGIDRMSAYTHVEDDLGSGAIGGDADAYLDLVEREALPFFRERYGVVARGSSLVVGGSSLGGLVTLYAALTRPTLAGCVIAMSPTLGWGAFGSDEAPGALVNRWSERGEAAVYLDSGGGGDVCGDADGDGVEEDDASARDNFCTTNQLRDHLAGLGYVFGEDLFHWYEAGAPHNEAAWAARVPGALAACVDGGWVAP